MEIGMMWYDADTKTSLVTKILAAVAYYRQKYGASPTHCFINPSMITGIIQMPAPAVVVVKTSRTILANHFWLGVEYGGPVPALPLTEAPGEASQPGLELSVAAVSVPAANQA